MPQQHHSPEFQMLLTCAQVHLQTKILQQQVSKLQKAVASVCSSMVSKVADMIVRTPLFPAEYLHLAQAFTSAISSTLKMAQAALTWTPIVAHVQPNRSCRLNLGGQGSNGLIDWRSKLECRICHMMVQTS